MIEKYIKNEQKLRKWRVFKNRRPAYYSIFGVLLLIFFSLTAEIWSNSKPLFMKYHGSFYFPVFSEYSAQDLGIEDAITVDFRNLAMADGDFALWPLNEWDPLESNKKVDEYPSPPTASNLLGTDDRGRDVLARLLYGLRYSLAYAFLVWVITFVTGTLIGAAQGYLGGRVDLIGQRLTEVLSTVPQLFLLIIIISVFKPNLFLLVLITCLFGWIPISYYMRAEFLKNRNLEFVEAARALGGGHRRVFFKHILPNSLTPLITFSPFAITTAISSLAALDYLGFGLTPPTPSWGELLLQAQQNFTIAWWLALFPSLALFVTLTLFSLIGEGVRDSV